MKARLLSTFFLASLLSGSLFFSCKPDPVTPPEPGNEEEVITTLKLSFRDSADASNTSTAVFKDVDGEGGQPPVVDTIRLDANKTYYAQVTLLDETKNPAADITEEIEEEANDHQLFYNISQGNIVVSYEDRDTNNPPLPLGLKTKWRTGNSGNGSIQIILKHQAGTKNNTQTPGETDIDVTFRTEIK